jgi:DNA-directed RNA polymerase beta' subunit
MSSKAPESLQQQAQEQLTLRVHEYCATMLPAVQFDTWVQFSGRAVLAPGSHLRLDQVGIAEELAWSLFGPLVTRELAIEEVQARSERAAEVLDEIMAREWVIIHRAPAFTPQTFLAFHPVRNSERVLRLHPLACRLLQADFDGDQAAIFLPLTKQAQREAGELLSVKGHLARTPDLLRELLPNNEALWGLASLSLTEEGKQELTDILGMNIVPVGEIVTRARLEDALHLALQRNDLPGTLESLEKLMQRGFAIARASGASISPFVGSQLSLPPKPVEDESKLWNRYQQEVSEWLAAHNDYSRPDLGPQLLAVKSGAWGQIEQLTALLSTQGSISDILGGEALIRHGYRDGLQAAELYALAPGARESFAQVQRDWIRITQEIRKRNRAESFHVLARAMRAEQPAIVFAHAASIREIDPLTDPDSRLFAGL